MPKPPFPHMLPREVTLWQRFLLRHEQEWERFAYDVKVGDGRDPGPEFPEEIRRMALEITKFRIDAVGFRLGEIGIFEVKVSAGLSAVGQLRAYRRLYDEQFRPTQMITTHLVTTDTTPDLIRVYRMEGITTYVLPEDGTEEIIRP